jgi:hypothetical protein
MRLSELTWKCVFVVLVGIVLFIAAFNGLPSGSREIEAIEVHHLRPRADEVANELFERVRASVDFRQRLRIRR